MNSLQFVLEEDSLYFPISPDVIDISSNSGDESLVKPGNVPQLEEQFRVNQTTHDVMTTFMGQQQRCFFPRTTTPFCKATSKTLLKLALNKNNGANRGEQGC